MKLAIELNTAIKLLESVCADLSQNREVCISDIESTVQELRGALWDATNGQAQIFREEGTDCEWYTVTVLNRDFTFFWPSSCDPIQALFVKDGAVWATSSAEGDLHEEPNKPVISQDPDASFVEIGKDAGFFGGHFWSIRAKKTNLRNCANPNKKAA